MTFEEFNFHPDIMKGIRDMRYEIPTPIQQQSIPPAMEGKDVIANAQTGSGKTAAFILPLMHRIIDLPEGKTRVLVLAPTRELASQIDEQALGFGYHTHLKSACVYGGVRMELQEQALKDGTAIIVATPGRLLDHHKYGSWRFDEITAVVLDEADRMLDMGFWPDIQAILAKLPEKKQMLLFSATMPQPIMELAKTVMHEPVHIKIDIAKPPSTINQVFYPVDSADKLKLLLELMKQKDMSSSIIFVSTKIGADRLYRALQERGFPVGVIHGDREQAERDKVLLDFRSGKVKVLVATDVASRGIDVDGITHVINFDMPPDPDSYVHRIGRTARAGESGEALSFITHEDAERVHTIETLIGKDVPRVVVPGFEVAARPARQDSYRGGRPQGGPSRHDGPRQGQGSGPRQGGQGQGPRQGQGSGPSRHDGPRPQGQGPRSHSSGPSRGGRDYRGPREHSGGAPRDPHDGPRDQQPAAPAGGQPSSAPAPREQAAPREFNGPRDPNSAPRGPRGPRNDYRGGQPRRHDGPRSGGQGQGQGPSGHGRGGQQGQQRGEHRGGPSSGPRPAQKPAPNAAPQKKKPFWWPF